MSRIIPLDTDNLIKLHVEEKVSVLQLAGMFGVSRPTIVRRLRGRGIVPMGRSEAETVKWSRMPPDRRTAQVAAANEAMRGSDPTGRLVISANTKARTMTKVGRGEAEVFAALAGAGLVPKLQAPLHVYNVDILCGPVAVEVSTSSVAGEPRGRLVARTKYLTDLGLDVIYVTIPRDRTIYPACLEYLIAFCQEAQRNPSPWRQYRVIRGSGKLVTALELNGDHWTPVEPLGRVLNADGIGAN